MYFSFFNPIVLFVKVSIFKSLGNEEGNDLYFPSICFCYVFLKAHALGPSFVSSLLKDLVNIYLFGARDTMVSKNRHVAYG